MKDITVKHTRHNFTPTDLHKVALNNWIQTAPFSRIVFKKDPRQQSYTKQDLIDNEKYRYRFHKYGSEAEDDHNVRITNCIIYTKDVSVINDPRIKPLHEPYGNEIKWDNT